MSTQSHNVKLTAEISATSKGLVDALNQASSAINSTSSNWKSKFDKLKDSTSVISQGVKNLGDLMKNAGEIDPSNMSALTNAIGEVSVNFDKVKGEVDAFVQKMSELKIAASNLGMPIEEYQAFADAVKASGVDFSEANNMLASMQQQILNLANGVPEAESLFSKLGVTIEQLSSNTVGANFQLLVNALNDTIPASERATQNMQLFKSSIDNTLQVAQQYQKTVSEQTNAYATDKEVQNAISLANAIDKLGGQLASLQLGTRTATQENEKFASSTQQVFDIIQNEKDTLENATAAYENYVNSLKNSTKSTLEASDALRVIAEKSTEAYDALVQLKTDNLPMPEGYKDSVLGTLLDSIVKSKETIAQEMKSVQDIMNQRIKAGAPIDMAELDKALEHVAQLFVAVKKLNSINAVMIPFDESDKQSLNEINMLLTGIDINFKRMSQEAQTLNNELDFKKLMGEVTEFEHVINDAYKKLNKGWKVKLNTKDIDAAIDKFRKLQTSGNGNEEVLTTLERYKRQMTAINSMSSANVSIWRRIGNSIASAYRRVMGYKDGVRDAKNESENLGTTFTKGIGQMMGMGSAVATVTLAMRNLVKLAKEYVKQLQEANKELTYGNLGANAESMSSARDKNDKRNEELISKLKEYSDLVKSERANPSNEATAKRRNLQDELNKLYGMRLNADNRGDVDAEIGRQLDKLTQARIKAIDAQIKANQRVSDGVDEFIDSFEGLNEFGDMLHAQNWKGYFKQIGYTFTGDVNGANAIKEAQERSTKAKEETNALMEQRRRLEREDLRKQFERMNDAKSADEAEKKRKDADEKAAKALEDANKKLEDWKNSLTDNDRQKNLRAIMSKYDEAVREGVSLEEARNVATTAIAKMLQKEREDEDKKNAELLKVVEDRIKAYKDAYKSYVEADKAVADAKKDYARTQKELANEAKSERISRRRERLQKAMGRFGFSLYEGFSLNESSSERRERRRNAQLDASISEKMARSQAGDRVHFTHAEKERLSEFQKLQKQDKRLEAAQKAMEAADKQKKAAEQLQEAAKAIKEAIYGRSEAGKDLKDAGKNLKEANSKRRKRSQEVSPEMIFDNARKSLNARGVSSSYSTKTIDYTTQFSTLHTDLQQIMKKAYLVR